MKQDNAQLIALLIDFNKWGRKELIELAKDIETFLKLNKKVLK